MAAAKKPTRSRSAATRSKPQPVTKGRLQNLAAPPSFGDDLTLDDQLVDNSGVFRVTAAIAQAQTGHEDDDPPRFASDSLVMAAQRDGFRQRSPALDDVPEEVAVDDEATAALKRERLRALAARDLARRSRR
ncbi:MAG TPA: hypothetical protein VLB44_00260 [Kofleriaceae bacterium]|nr:hypothetical protein [Kofleriaceae bacterium]